MIRLYICLCCAYHDEFSVSCRHGERGGVAAARGVAGLVLAQPYKREHNMSNQKEQPHDRLASADYRSNPFHQTTS